MTDKFINKMNDMRCLLLFSGGLDSILAAKLLQKQNIQVDLITFESYFFNSEQSQKAAKELGLKLHIVNFSDKHLIMVKNPQYGYGKNMNPCIDCHLMMLRKAKEIMDEEKYDFIATGEVLDERPMSQNKSTLRMLEKKSGLEGRLLRPLSAKLLDPTILEKENKINREELEDIHGRSRKRQLELAKEFKIKGYPTPAGGCLLTDPNFSQRLKELFEKWPDCSGDDVELLKIGRHFWFDKVKIVIGRDKEENNKIRKLVQPRDYLLYLKNFPGPTTLVRGKEVSKFAIIKAGELTAWYSTKARQKKQVEIVVKTNKEEKIMIIRAKR